MKPGPELDAAVAERVMGWTYVQFPDGQMPEAKHWSPPGKEYVRGHPPHYSTDWRAAGEVWDKLGREGCYFAMATHDDGEQVGVMVKHKNGTEEFEWGDTAPHAIALAALAWADSQTEGQEES